MLAIEFERAVDGRIMSSVPPQALWERLIISTGEPIQSTVMIP